MDTDATREQPGTEAERTQLRLAELSNTMVRVYKEQFGRGPTKTRTNYADYDIVITTLESSLTPAERRMADLGEHQRLRDARMFLQYAARQEFTEMVERITDAGCAPS